MFFEFHGNALDNVRKYKDVSPHVFFHLVCYIRTKALTMQNDVGNAKQVCHPGAGAGVGVGVLRGSGSPFIEQVAWFLGILVPWFLDFKVPKFRSFKDSEQSLNIFGRYGSHMIKNSSRAFRGDIDPIQLPCGRRLTLVEPGETGMFL